MALHRGIDNSGPDRAAPVGRLVRRHQRREVAISGRLGAGTLACPACDAPTAPPAAPLSATDALGCGFCGHAARVRDFLSLDAPPRPTRVEVRVVERSSAPSRAA